MSKTLILTEKPSVGREIARVLGCRRNNNGYIEGDKYIVTWALGHLVTLSEPEAYGEQYKKWSMETLPIIPEKMQLKVIPETSKQYAVVKKLLNDKDIDNVIIATDAGREGELVARWIIAKAGCKKPLKRLWISSQTDKAIKNGFNELKDGKDYYNLYMSAQARAEADWIVGFNVTRALTCKHNAQLSGGRVQTPTLAIIVRREHEIRNFRAKDYYTVRADLDGFFATYQNENGNSQIFDKNFADDLAKKLEGAEFKVVDIKNTKKSAPPPALYDLTELQRDANKLYGMSAKQTLSVMQRLYEQYKALTYPRTDSRYLTDDIVPTLGERLAAVSVGEFSSIVSRIRSEKRVINSACINNSKVTDHHAIIPTEERADVLSMSTYEKRIYLLVVKRFLSNFFPNYEYMTIKAELSALGHRFTASGRTVIESGWRDMENIVDDDEKNEQYLPSFVRGAVFKCDSVQMKAQKTTPPSRYTEASLLSEMENPSKYITDRAMKSYIGGGLGTPATRADIIEKLFSSFYIEKNGTSLIPTSKGMQLIDIVPDDLREPLLTATWEQQLEAISKGNAQRDKFIGDIKVYTEKLIDSIECDTREYIHNNLTRTPCPVCGKMMLEVKGKRGTQLVCQDRECNGRVNISMESNVRCPNCHKKMEIFGEKEKRRYVCRCGFRESVEKFHEGKKTNSASKGTVREYMKRQEMQQNNDESAFALALKAASKKG